MTTAATSLSPEAQAFLKALASSTRQQIMFAFDGGSELTVGDVAKRLELAQSAASTHLATLRDAGILTSRRDWKTVYYRANPAGFLKSLDDLRDYLLACCPPDCAAPPDATAEDTT
ncbi:ArsR/SmtB family transcription factor [Stackebrandtia nassauensis]|uniref:Transcriptional regulator, ArsR family n=1 Tax=Stackebrandtia nassauensis (strain DSM 44728 / CIP 108903 / NRRL B-16338 / NBRC 102104 / LLR-40K-21) TaxID=446470 RepID=D3PVH5_STANL|nr:metalloregulator ArsR/SmtB family transcription factor [Stackebrandtia nassauensis]ADD43089.1 transcriptional regulator, ArsR family [Stackebrandtia nassauensis DSM 44728]